MMVPSSMLLLSLLLCSMLLLTTDAFFVSPSSCSSSSVNARSRLNAEETPGAAPVNNQALYGQGELEMPDTFVRCGACQSHYAFTPDDLGDRGRGRRMECSVCGNTWFQSRDRIMTLNQDMELVPLPAADLERIELNRKENKPPGFQGDGKLYIGNVSFQCSRDDLLELFGEHGSVGDVSMVYDNETGLPRGFAFVTMRTQEEADAALAVLDGADIQGRNINVRHANK